MATKSLFIHQKKLVMTFLGVLLTVMAAIIVSVLFYYVFKSTGPWENFWIFLLILTLAGLAAGFWIAPVGPVMWGIAWVPILIVIIIFALLLGAASPRQQERTVTNSENGEPAPQDRKAATIGALFWILLIFLLGAIVWKFMGGHPLP
jgi:K+ transporter